MTAIESKRNPRRADEDIEDEEDPSSIKSFKMKSIPIATAWKCHIDQPFMDVRQFQDLVEVLENARPGDNVEIKLSTPGGALHAVLPLLTALAGTEATVFVHAVSDVASAGTFLLMMADAVYVNPYSTIMFHQVSYGAAGQGNHVEDRVSYVAKASKTLLRDLYQGFLTEAELESLFQGKEFWMDKGEFDERYKSRVDFQNQIGQEIVAEAVEKPKRKRAKKAVAE